MTTMMTITEITAMIITTRGTTITPTAVTIAIDATAAEIATKTTEIIDMTVATIASTTTIAETERNIMTKLLIAAVEIPVMTTATPGRMIDIRAEVTKEVSNRHQTHMRNQSNTVPLIHTPVQLTVRRRQTTTQNWSPRRGET